MSYTVLQKPESRGSLSTRPENEQLYIARGSGDVAQLEADLVASIPYYLNGRPLERIDYIELYGGPPESCYEVAARYQFPELVDLTTPGTSAYAFAVTTATQHITQAKQHVAQYAKAGKFAANHGGAIGINSDGTVEGCEIVVAQFAFDETHLFTNAQVTNAFKGIIFGLCGKTNNAPFKGLATDEGLFMGATGGKRQDTNWEITFNLAGSPNVTNLTIGAGTAYGPITGINKKGWEYLWVEYVTVEVNDGGIIPARRMATVPRQVNVERVYDAGDFSTLGIGT